MDRKVADQERLWQRRCARLWRWLQEQPIDGLLVVRPANVTYLTGFSGDSSWLLVGREAPLMVSDGRYEEQLRCECPGLESVIRATTGEPMERAVRRAVERLGVAAVGFEAEVMTVAALERLRQEVSSVVFSPVSGVVERLRAVKEPQEVEAIRGAIARAEAALRDALEQVDLRLEPSEAVFAGALNAAMRRRGAIEEAFTPIVASGPRAALPHARLDPSARLQLETGVLVDWGARYRLYVSDLTRMITRPRMAPSLRNVIDAVVRAKERAIAALRPGVPAATIHAEAAAVLDQAGFGDFFKHSVGHGIGLEVHEEPFLRLGSQTLLQPGMVVTIEPGVYLPGELGVRVEEDVLITEHGPEVLTSLPSVLTVD